MTDEANLWEENQIEEVNKCADLGSFKFNSQHEILGGDYSHQYKYEHFLWQIKKRIRVSLGQWLRKHLMFPIYWK